MQRARVILDLSEGDVDSAETSKRYSIQELSRIRKLFDEINAEEILASDKSPGQESREQ